MPEGTLAALRNDTPRKDDRLVLSFQFKGYLIQIGQNCFSNEKLIQEHPHKECLWMHAMAARGSHLVLCISGRPDPDETVIQYTASLALKHSHSEARSVSVALLKDLVKPDGFAVGVFKPVKSETVEVA